MTDLISSAASGAANMATVAASAGLTASFLADQQMGKLHGLAPAFQVKVDPDNKTATGVKDLGFWSGCTGLKVTWDFITIKTGNYGSSPVSVPRGIKYDNVTLKRGMTKMGWLGPAGMGGGLRKWLKDLTTNPPDWEAGPKVEITLFDAWSDPVAIWILENVFPVSWQGPDLDAAGKNIAMETLVLTHDGFLNTDGSVPAATSGGVGMAAAAGGGAVAAVAGGASASIGI